MGAVPEMVTDSGASAEMVTDSGASARGEGPTTTIACGGGSEVGGSGLCCGGGHTRGRPDDRATRAESSEPDAEREEYLCRASSEPDAEREFNAQSEVGCKAEVGATGFGVAFHPGRPT